MSHKETFQHLIQSKFLGLNHLQKMLLRVIDQKLEHGSRHNGMYVCVCASSGKTEKG